MEQKIDLFTAIHKAIRTLLYETGKQLQTANLADEHEMLHIFHRLDYTISLLQEHGRHEDDLIFPEIEKIAPGSTDEAESQHRGYEDRVERLQHLIIQIKETKEPTKRLSLSGELIRAYTDFMAYYLVHMNSEEETVLPLSQEKPSNEELTAIRVKVQMNINPNRYAQWLQWMLPSLHINELVPLFSQVKSSAPAPVFEKFRQIGQKYIDEKRWKQLSRQVEIV